MIIQSDFKELLQLLEKHNVEYMIVGGYAVAFHGYPRLTKDLDIFYRLTEMNVENLTSALVEFGFSIEAVQASKLSDPGDLVAFGLPPVRVDLMNSITGVTFEEAAANLIRKTFDDMTARFIGREDLIRNKQATTRLQDKLDVEKLS